VQSNDCGILDSRFEHCIASNGGALTLLNASNAQITGNAFIADSAGRGGAVYLSGMTDVVVSRNVAYSCDAALRGAFLYATGVTDLTVSENTIVNSRGAGGDGITLQGGTNTTLKNNLLLANAKWGVGFESSAPFPLSLEYNGFWQNGSGTVESYTPSGTNVETDPIVFDTARHLFFLLPGSPYIDAGDPASPVPLGGGARIDIGAVEYTGVSFVPLTLIAPTAGDSIFAPMPTLIWMSAVDSLSFEIYDENRILLSDISAFQWSDTVNVGSDTAWTFPDSLPRWSTWYWRVEAVNDTGGFALSPTRKFLVTYPFSDNTVRVPADYQTLPDAIYAAFEGDTIAVSAGIYGGFRLGSKRLTVRSASTADTPWVTGTILLENVPEGTVLSGLAVRPGVSDKGIVASGSSVIRNMLIRRCYRGLEFGSGYLRMEQCTVDSCVQGVLLLAPDSALAANNRFYWNNNNVGPGGGIAINGGYNVRLERNVFYGNQSIASGGAVWIGPALGVQLHNNTIVSNSSPSGAGIYVQSTNSLQLINNIVFNNNGWGVAGGLLIGTVIEYNDFYTNLSGPVQGHTLSATNLQQDPLLSNVSALDFSLLPGSPCIDAGDPSSSVPPNGGSIIDIGAVEFEYTVGVGDPDPLPRVVELHQNYPNPFNAGTVIKFDLPNPSRIELIVFNILGQRVAGLATGDFPAGQHSISWAASGNDGPGLPSGVYFLRLKTGEDVHVKRMLLLK
jgi:hypothetical protein